MNNILVDFRTGIDKLSNDLKQEFETDLSDAPGIFSLMEPLDGALEAHQELSQIYDTYILSTAPWKNPSSWSDKLNWVKKYLGNQAYMRLILSHHKHLNLGHFLVDDRLKNGAEHFSGEHIHFGTELFPDWNSVLLDLTLNGNQALEYRKIHSQPIVDGFFTWAWEQRQRADLVPTDEFLRALNYAHAREHALRVFLTDGNVPMDTNHVERALRVVPMKRKNWLFAWTKICAEHIGIIQSLLVTCKLHDVNPYDYLVDVLQRVDRHPAGQVTDLTPRL